MIAVRVLTLAVATMVALAVRMLRPVVRVRFGAIPTGRIGPLAARPEIHLCEREAGLHGDRVLDIFYPEGPALGTSAAVTFVCNEELLRMWQRALRIHPFVRDLARVSGRLPGAAAHAVRMRDERDVHGVLAARPPHLRFTAARAAEADAGMRELGVPPGSPFVAFHARDPAYLSITYPAAGSWRYHDYRDADVATYLPAARELVRRGMIAVRMGAIVQRRLDVAEPGIIDYASSGKRSDLLDLALSARCRFFLGNDSGLFYVPVVFRRPIALANYVLVAVPPIFSKDDLFITKKVWKRDDRRFLTLTEMLDLPDTTEGYAARGLDLIDNTPEEILDLAVEMDERISGSWIATGEDEARQARARSILSRALSIGPNLSRMGARFLAQNEHLLR